MKNANKKLMKVVFLINGSDFSHQWNLTFHGGMGRSMCEMINDPIDIMNGGIIWNFGLCLFHDLPILSKNMDLLT
jgi:hypothetical protein